MKHIKQTELTAQFYIKDLEKELGTEQASAFARAYRHAIKIIEEMSGLVEIKCADLNLLIAMFKTNNFEG